MKFITTILITLFSYTFNVIDINDDVLNAFKQNKSAEVAKYFDEKISLKIITQEDVLSKAQAESNLKFFFEKHPIKAYTKQKTTSINSSSYYLNTNLEGENEKFRLTLLIRRNLIAQMRIEQLNE
jgi:hypothetical protein